MDMYLNYLKKRLAAPSQQLHQDPMDTAILIKEALRYEPDNPGLMANLAYLLNQMGCKGEAYLAAQRSCHLDPQSPARAITEVIENPPLPKQVTLELSTVCNLKCPLCRNGTGLLTRPPALMSLEDFQKIWANLGPSIKQVLLVGSGESFLNPNIYDILDHIPRDVYIYIDTNANVDMDFDRIIDSGLNELVFSMDGLTQEMYQRYRRGGNLERVLANLRGLVQAKRSRGATTPKIVFKFIIFKHTEMYLEEAKAVGQMLGVDELRIEPCTFKPWFSKELFQQFMPLGPAFQRIEYVDFEQGIIGPEPSRDSSHCSIILDSLAVTVDGGVSPCCVLDESVLKGNLLENDLASIWNSKPYRKFRLQVLQDRWQLPACHVCSMSKINPGRLLEGTILAPEEPAGPPDSGNRYYVSDNRISAQEIAQLMAEERGREAQYFISIGKAEPEAALAAAAGAGQTMGAAARR